MSRRTALAAAAALAALAGCAALGNLAGAAFAPPRLTFESWSPEAFDLDGVTIALHYRLDNPNAVGVDLERLAYRLEVEGHQMAAGQLPAGLHVAARGATPLAVPVRLRWGELPGFAEALLTRSDVAYRISGEVGIGSPLGTLVLPFAHQDRVALPRLPGIRFLSVSVRETTLSHLALDLRLEVANGNAFPLPVGALTYGLRVGKDDLLSGGAHPLAAVPAGGRSVVTIPFRASLLGAAGAVANLLGGAEVRLRGLADYGPLRLPLDVGGKVSR